MGILDDAIREHLELKRSAGGDASEVARLEREAFGDEEAPAAPAEAVEPPAPEPAAPAPPQSPPEPVPPSRPEPQAAAAAAVEPAAVEQPTRQFTLEEVEDAERREASSAVEQATGDTEHDELEETPDFLQETPEHDRLWFEQKPPKDFDF